MTENGNVRRMPMSALIHFEAVARLGSFTLAAKELNVTQAAVSKQIKGLEAQLKVRLFERNYRSITLTTQGLVLSQTMTRSLASISHSLQEISPEPVEDELVISALVSFATLWLAPRLGEFLALHPSLRIRLQTRDENAALDFSNIDVAFRFGDGLWQDCRSTLLFADRVFAVASPSYISNFGKLGSLSELRGRRLIGYDRAQKDWLDWNDWLSSFGDTGTPVRVASQYSFYSDAVSAALRGDGILLGWQGLISNHLSSGALVQLTNNVFVSTSAHYALTARGSVTNPHVKEFMDWLRSYAVSEEA